MSPVTARGPGPLGSRSVGPVCLVYSEKVQDPDPIGTLSRFRIPEDVRPRSQPAVIVGTGIGWRSETVAKCAAPWRP